MPAMKRQNTRRIFGAAAVLGLALAALAFYAVRDLLAAFVLFSVAFFAIGAAVLLVATAEEALVWGMRWTEGCFGRFRARHLALASHPAHASRFRRVR
jgi:hypothetical protein